MISVFHGNDAKTHQTFQAWRKANVDGFHMTEGSAGQFTIHYTQDKRENATGRGCSHQGRSDNAYSEDGCYTAAKKVCSNSLVELIAWATEHGFTATYCKHCDTKRFPFPNVVPQSPAVVSAANDWLKNRSGHTSAEGPAADELSKTAAVVTAAGYFLPASLKDERQKTLREIVERRGQPNFRDEVIAAYGGRCAVTGCDAVASLEAAHIIPYCGQQSHHVTNGLLLRADIHTLFDLDLIGIDPKTHLIHLAPPIMATSYREFHGRKLNPPADAANAPSHEALGKRWKQFVDGCKRRSKSAAL